jgi:hypothetical protein
MKKSHRKTNKQRTRRYTARDLPKVVSDLVPRLRTRTHQCTVESDNVSQSTAVTLSETHLHDAQLPVTFRREIGSSRSFPSNNKENNEIKRLKKKRKRKWIQYYIWRNSMSVRSILTISGRRLLHHWNGKGFRFISTTSVFLSIHSPLRRSHHIIIVVVMMAVIIGRMSFIGIREDHRQWRRCSKETVVDRISSIIVFFVDFA